jgi:S-adenosylmethionine decarboxylase proenzyme
MPMDGNIGINSMKIVDENADAVTTEDEISFRKQFLGNHVLCEFYDCDKNIIDDITSIEKILLSVADKCQSTVLKKSFHKFTPQGVSGIVLIEESHLSIHTWPEFMYAAVDIFTCSSTIQEKMQNIADFLVKSINSQKFSVLLIKRGQIPDDCKQKYGAK